MVEPQDQRQHGKGEKNDQCHEKVGQLHKLFGVEPGLLIIACAHTAGYHRYHGKADGKAGNALEGADRVADGVGGHGSSTQNGDGGEKQDLAQLEHAAFQTVGHAKAEDVPENAAVMMEGEPFHLQRQTGAEQQKTHHSCRNTAGDQRGDGNACHAKVKAEDQNGVSGHIDAVHQEGYPHGDPGIAHHPEQRRAGAVNGEEGGGSFYN